MKIVPKTMNFGSPNLTKQKKKKAQKHNKMSYKKES